MLLPGRFLENLENNLDAVLKVKNVNSTQMTNLYNKMCTFLRDYNDFRQKEVCVFVRCTVKYIECISFYVSSSEQDIGAVKRYCEIISDIPRLPKVQCTYLQEISQIILEKVTELVEPIWFVKELLVSFNIALKYFNRDLLHNFMSNNIFSLYKLADVLNLCGDYNYQVKILETIFYMCSADQIIEYSSNCFPESIILQNAFRRIQSGNFNFGVRKFLNLINRESSHVISIKCERIMLDSIWVGEPKGCVDSELWVDFNEGPNTISILCDVDSLKTTSSPNESSNKETWELITLYTENVQNVLLSRWLDENYANSRGAVVCFNLIKPCSVLYASSKQAAQAKQLKLAILNGSALTQLENHVLPTKFMENFKRLSPPSSVVLQQRTAVVETSRKYFEEVQMSVDCDKPPAGECDLNSLSFQSALDEHLDTSYTSFNETTLNSPCHTDLQHRAKSNNQRTLIGARVPVMDKLLSENCDSSGVSTHLTNFVLDYIDLTVNDGCEEIPSPQTFIQSPQNNYRITTAVYSNSEQYYSIPAANTAAVIDLTYSNPNEDLQCNQSDEYFTANEAFVGTNTYNSRGRYLLPMIVENKSLRKLLSMIEEENEVEMRSLNEDVGYDSVGNNQQLKTKNTDDEISPSTTEKEQPKGVLISTGTFIEDIPKRLPRKKVLKKKSLKAKTSGNSSKPHKITKHPVENQHSNHESDETESPEHIVEQLLSTFDEITPTQPKESETKASQDDRVHVGSVESTDKESLTSSKNLRKSIRNGRKTKACSENQAEVASIEIPTKASLLMSQQPLVIFHKLTQEEVGAENHVDVSSGDLVNEVKEVQQVLVDQVVDLSQIVAGSDVLEATLSTENTFADEYAQTKITHQKIETSLRQKQQLKRILFTDANHEEEKADSIHALVNNEEDMGQKNHEVIFFAPSPNVAQEGYEVQEETVQSEFPKENQPSSVILGDLKLNGDQSRQGKSTNDEEEEMLRSEDQEEEQTISGNLADPENTNKLPKPSKNMTEEVSESNGQNSHVEENSYIFKQNLSKRDQFASAHKSSRDDPLIMKEITLTKENSKQKKHTELQKNVKTGVIQIDDPQKFNTKIPVVRLARLNVVKDSKTGVCQIDNIKKYREVNQSHTDKEISNMEKSKPHVSRVLTPNNDENRIKPSTTYDVHTELVLSQSRKYKRRSNSKIETKENLAPPTKRKMTRVRKLYNPNDLSYTKLFMEDDFDENTSHYSKSTIENPKVLRSLRGFKQNSAKKSTKKKKDRTAIDENMTLQNEKANTTFRWKLKKQTKEDEAKMMNNHKENRKRTRIGDENNDEVARNANEDISIQEENQPSGRKGKENSMMINNTLGKTQRKRKIEEDLDPFDEILTKKEKADSRRLAQTREKLGNSRKFNHSTTYQSRNYYDISSVFEILEKTRQFDKTFTTTSTKRHKSSKNRQTNKSNSRSKKLYRTDVMRGKDPHDGYESLYSDAEESKLPVEHKKPLEKNEKEPKHRKYTKIIPTSSKMFDAAVPKKTKLSQKEQYSNKLSPLPELNFEHEMEPLRVESEPRLTSSNSTLQTSPILKRPKINILSNIIVRTAPNNNIVGNSIPLTMDKQPPIVIPSTVYKSDAEPLIKNTESRPFSQASTVIIPPELLKAQDVKKMKLQTLQEKISHLSAIQELPSTTNNLEMDNLSAITMITQCTASSTSMVGITPTNEDILNWVATGLAEAAANDVKNILECVMSSFKDLIREFLHKIRGPVCNDLVDLYELLMKLDNDFTEYFNQT